VSEDIAAMAKIIIGHSPPQLLAITGGAVPQAVEAFHRVRTDKIQIQSSTFQPIP
jgi:hypothetical protein